MQYIKCWGIKIIKKNNLQGFLKLTYQSQKEGPGSDPRLSFYILS